MYKLKVTIISHWLFVYVLFPLMKRKWKYRWVCLLTPLSSPLHGHTLIIVECFPENQYTFHWWVGAKGILVRLLVPWVICLDFGGSVKQSEVCVAGPFSAFWGDELGICGPPVNVAIKNGRVQVDHPPLAFITQSINNPDFSQNPKTP